jgi:hypothetical protein
MRRTTAASRSKIPDPGVRQPLQDVGGFDLLAPQPGGLAHDDRGEGGTGGQGREERRQARPVDELGAGDTIVNVDVRRIRRPALARRVGRGVLDLPRDALLGIGKILIGALAGVDGGDHRRSLILSCFDRCSSGR